MRADYLGVGWGTGALPWSGRLRTASVLGCSRSRMQVAGPRALQAYR